MAAVTIRNLSNEAHRALKVRAAQHNRSAEAEMRAILEAAVRPEDRLRIGTALSEGSQKIGLTNADVEALERVRDTRSAQLMEPLGSEDAMPWAELDRLGDRPFMPEGREQPAVPTDRTAFDR